VSCAVGLAGNSRCAAPPAAVGRKSAQVRSSHLILSTYRLKYADGTRVEGAFHELGRRGMQSMARIGTRLRLSPVDCLGFYRLRKGSTSRLGGPVGGSFELLIRPACNEGSRSWDECEIHGSTEEVQC